MKLQHEAEKTAEKAIKQLEEFINEDAQLDRENAEKAIEMLRQRSRTLSQINVQRLDADGNPLPPEDNAKAAAAVTGANAAEAAMAVLQRQVSGKTEKISVTIDNMSLRFATKQNLDKLINFINFESSNKFMFILNNQQRSSSRPGTRGGSQNGHRRSPTPNNGGEDPLNKSFVVDGNGNKESVEDVLTKVLTDDEQLLADMRDNMKSRSSLRNKHMQELEENKASLNEIKAKATKQKMSSAKASIDQEFPPHGGEELQRGQLEQVG